MGIELSTQFAEPTRDQSCGRTLALEGRVLEVSEACEGLCRAESRHCHLLTHCLTFVAWLKIDLVGLLFVV